MGGNLFAVDAASARYERIDGDLELQLTREGLRDGL